MADLYDGSFSSSSSLESEDMSSFLQTFLNNPSTKPKLTPYESPISADFVDSDHRFSDLTSFYSPDSTNQVQKTEEGSQSSNPTRSSKRTRAAEIHNLSEKRRRSRINEKLKALQTLVPNSNKTDKASMLDEAIEYLKQLQLKVQTLTMRNGFGLPPVYSQEQEMQIRMGYNEGYRLPNPSEGVVTFSQTEGFSMRREYGIPNHIGMPSLTTMMKPDPSFCSELANENQYRFANHSTSMKEINRPSKLPKDVTFSGKGVSS